MVRYRFSHDCHSLTISGYLGTNYLTDDEFIEVELSARRLVECLKDLGFGDLASEI